MGINNIVHVCSSASHILDSSVPIGMQRAIRLSLEMGFAPGLLEVMYTNNDKKGFVYSIH